MFLTLSLLLLAVAQSPAMPAETFEMTVDGAPFGSEEFRRSEGPDGHPLSYALNIDAPGQQVVLRATPTSSGYALSVTPKGAAEARALTALVPQVLQAEVPVQRAVLNRKGFEPAAVATSAGPNGPGADRRETALAVKGSGGALPATFLMPKSDTPVPAVVFLSGSGPNDKDETIGPNKPFADLARGLGDRGIASLRFDKRTLAIKDKTKLADVQLKDEYYDDAAVALALLAATGGVDPARIFVLGHSEGAMVAPQAAAAFPGTRGIVMMAPGVRPLDVMLIDQMEFGAKLTGRSADEIAEQTQQLNEAFAVIRDPQKKDTPPFMGAPASYWREVIALDVPKMVRDSKLPILVLQGDEDFQVRKDADFELLKTRAGTSGGRVTYRSFPGLNHLFMKVEGPSTGAEYGIPGRVDPAVATAIADWIFLH